MTEKEKKPGEIDKESLAGKTHAGIDNASSVIGFDTQRLWVNAAQVFANEDSTVIVFRETANVRVDGRDEEAQLTRNVASFVMPTETAKNLGEILTRETSKFDVE